MRWFAGLIAAGCLAGCLPYRGDEPRDLAREEPRWEGGGGLDYVSVEGDALDGKAYGTELVEVDAPGEVDEEPKLGVYDMLHFRDGRMESKFGRAHGFYAAPYELEAGDDDAIKFTATDRKGDATLEWNGTVWRGHIAGTAVLREPGKAPVEWSFKSAPDRAEPLRRVD